MSHTPQSAILTAPGAAGYSLEFDVADDLSGGRGVAALTAIARALPPHSVLGIGHPLTRALGVEIPGLAALETLAGAATLMAKQHGLWVFLSSDTTSGAYEAAQAILDAARSAFVVSELTPLFRYRECRDLTGYLDGTANPHGKDAREAAVVAKGPLAGGAFALTQRFVHDLQRFSALSDAAQNHVIGTAKSDGRELADAPETAHVKRTAQDRSDPPEYLLRRSMPWGDVGRAGLQFIAFACELSRIDRSLRRMVGLDGPADALLGYTRAETGGYYYCPPLAGGQVDLSLFARA